MRIIEEKQQDGTWAPLKAPSSRIPEVTAQDNGKVFAVENGLWTVKDLGLGLKENTSNKVTTLTASSTDIQYPSAKAVYDEVTPVKESLNNFLRFDEAQTLTGSVVETTGSPTVVTGQKGQAMSNMGLGTMAVLNYTVTATF